MEDRSNWTKAQWDAAQAEFNEKYNPPKPEDIECLNLVLKKEYAEEIARGEKTVEFRPITDFYISRLVDKKVQNWCMESGLPQEDINDFTEIFRKVKKIHFYSYSNTWHLDVECVDNYVIAATEENGLFLKEKYGSDELLNLSRNVKDLNGELPTFFYFALGKVIDKKL